MTLVWTSDEIARATRGAPPETPFSASGVSIDSRTTLKGDLFVALRDGRDGHEYIDSAIAAGAVGSLVDRPVRGPFIRVGDTLSALRELGAVAISRATLAQRIAITGSVGKTSVTQAIAAAAELVGLTHRPQKSQNNHIGVPLTLARMPSDTRYAVFELGMNHADEIRPLARLAQPHVALVTKIGAVHTENFVDGELGVARAKAEIFEGPEQGGIAILNADDVWFEMLAGLARESGGTVLSFSSQGNASARLTAFERRGNQSVATIQFQGRERQFRLAQPVRHWAENSLAILLACNAVGVPIDAVEQALESFAPVYGRGDTHQIRAGRGTATIINDSYNANPISMRAAFENLRGHECRGRRLAVVTDMLELGTGSATAHAELADVLSEAGVDLVFAAGPMMRRLYDRLPEPMKGSWAEDADSLATPLLAAVAANDVVLVKGSNGSRAWALAKMLLDK